jgi:hypothetical protein
MARAAELARGLAETAGAHVEGRPLSAAHADLVWPDAPHLVLWHAQSILREYRGDGHVALLLTHGLSGLDALVTHAATGDMPSGALRSTRGWSEEQWDAAVGSLRGRGWLAESDDLALHRLGRRPAPGDRRRTDALAAGPYASLGKSVAPSCAPWRVRGAPSSPELLFR